MNRQTLAAALLTLALAAASLWLSRTSERAPPTRPGAPGHVADYFITDFTATTLGPDGNPKDRLSAAAMTHYADDGTADLTQPHLVVFRDGSAPWNLYAEKGHSNSDGSLITLTGNVRLVQNEGTANQVQLVTDHMTIRPKAKTAQTDAPLTITGPRARVTAVGLQADLRQEQMTLLSNVRGHYEPLRR